MKRQRQDDTASGCRNVRPRTVERMDRSGRKRRFEAVQCASGGLLYDLVRIVMTYDLDYRLLVSCYPPRSGPVSPVNAMNGMSAMDGMQKQLCVIDPCDGRIQVLVAETQGREQIIRSVPGITAVVRPSEEYQVLCYTGMPNDDAKECLVGVPMVGLSGMVTAVFPAAQRQNHFASMFFGGDVARIKRDLKRQKAVVERDSRPWQASPTVLQRLGRATKALFGFSSDTLDSVRVPPNLVYAVPVPLLMVCELDGTGWHLMMNVADENRLLLVDWNAKRIAGPPYHCENPWLRNCWAYAHVHQTVVQSIPFGKSGHRLFVVNLAGSLLLLAFAGHTPGDSVVVARWSPTFYIVVGGCHSTVVPELLAAKPRFCQTRPQQHSTQHSGQRVEITRLSMKSYQPSANRLAVLFLFHGRSALCVFTIDATAPRTHLYDCDCDGPRFFERRSNQPLKELKEPIDDLKSEFTVWHDGGRWKRGAGAPYLKGSNDYLYLSAYIKFVEDDCERKPCWMQSLPDGGFVLCHMNLAHWTKEPPQQLSFWHFDADGIPHPKLDVHNVGADITSDSLILQD